MPTIIISEMQVKGRPGQYRHQLAKVKQTDYHGNKVTREFWLPVERDQDVYALGVYELSERSFYVDRPTQHLMLMPRLQWVRPLKHLQAQADQAGDPLPDPFDQTGQMVC